MYTDYDYLDTRVLRAFFSADLARAHTLRFAPLAFAIPKVPSRRYRDPIRRRILAHIAALLRSQTRREDRGAESPRSARTATSRALPSPPPRRGPPRAGRGGGGAGPQAQPATERPTFPIPNPHTDHTVRHMTAELAACREWWNLGESVWPCSCRVVGHTNPRTPRTPQRPTPNLPTPVRSHVGNNT